MELLDLSDDLADHSEEGRKVLEDDLLVIDMALNEPSNPHSPLDEKNK